MDSLKRKLLRLHWICSEQFGFDPLRLARSIRGIPAFVADLISFKKNYKGELRVLPCFGDRFAEGGSAKNEYFWQDLLVAKAIFDENPSRHVDIGSRVDGFVAHLACFRVVEVFDIRPLSITIPGVVFKQADLMSVESVDRYALGKDGYCDSISCLHALEHFGLGRYGDRINSDGYKLGLQSIAHLLKPLGRCYLSTPIGRQRVEFNANWVFRPSTVIEQAQENGLILERLTVIGGNGEINDIGPNDQQLTLLGQADYNLGIFIFRKQA